MTVHFPKPYADLVARLRVPFGFLIGIAFAQLARPDGTSLAIGLPVSAIGLLLRGWAAGHLRKNQALAQSGPYAWLRNPLYLGTLIVAAGLVIAARRWELAMLTAAVSLLIYFPVIALEEQHLRKLFPAFAEYERRVKMLVPRLPRVKAAEHFAWPVYWRNQEYKAAAGFLIGAAYLIWRMARAG